MPVIFITNRVAAARLPDPTLPELDMDREAVVMGWGPAGNGKSSNWHH